MSNRDRIILQKIAAYCEQIRQTHQYFHEDQNLFFDEQEGFVYRNSVAMPILQIGELVKRLSEDYVLENKAIPWRAIMGMRDIFAHHYGSVDYQELWQTTHEDVNDLANYLQQQE
ncbi:MAG: DUF86 domain-containing protein [Oscillospiraceae bacterium]|nr:DUF86 domain-containing protein [Oscillospiraceae bacterium]